MESNSKGARSKISSPLEKSEKPTAETKKCLTVLIMNAKGPNQGDGSTKTRRQIIQNVIKTYEPDLVLFQELKWTQSDEDEWSSNEILKQYRRDQDNSEASIMYNENKLIVTKGDETIYKKFLTIKNDSFDPTERMCLRVVETMGGAVPKFICISWHGMHRKVNKETKIKHFKNLMPCLENIHIDSELQILIGGDFNVDRKSIKDDVKPFYLPHYQESERRKDKAVIDYCIVSTGLYIPTITPVDLKDLKANKSEEMHLPDMTQLDLKKDLKADKPEEQHLSDTTPVDQKKGLEKDKQEMVLDHDPIIVTVEPAPPSDTGPALDKVTVTNGERDDWIPLKQLHRSDTTPVDLKKDLEADKPEGSLDHHPIIAMQEPAPLSDTAPILDKATVTNGETDESIISTELDLSSTTPGDIKKDIEADKPEEVLNHVPITAMLEPAPLSDMAPALDEVTDKISKKDK